MIIKADVRGVNEETRFLSRGLSPASHFSLNCTAVALLDRYSARVFIEGDAIVLASLKEAANQRERCSLRAFGDSTVCNSC